MVIVDTSIVYKWVTEEDKGVGSPALSLLQQFLTGKEDFLAPDILLYELANALSTKTSLSWEEIEKAWAVFEDLHLRIANPSLKFTKESMRFSKNHHVSVYDAFYIVLAKEKKCNFITADAQLVKKVNLPSIKLLQNYTDGD